MGELSAPPSSESSSAVSSPQMYAGAAVDEDVAGAEDACLPSLVDGGLEDLVLREVLAADVDEDAIGLDRVRGDEAAFEQPVRHATITSRS